MSCYEMLVMILVEFGCMSPVYDLDCQPEGTTNPIDATKPSETIEATKPSEILETFGPSEVSEAPESVIKPVINPVIKPVIKPVIGALTSQVYPSDIDDEYDFGLSPRDIKTVSPDFLLL